MIMPELFSNTQSEPKNNEAFQEIAWLRSELSQMPT
jgi:hypothetical protein